MSEVARLPCWWERPEIPRICDVEAVHGFDHQPLQGVASALSGVWIERG